MLESLKERQLSKDFSSFTFHINAFQQEVPQISLYRNGSSTSWETLSLLTRDTWAYVSIFAGYFLKKIYSNVKANLRPVYQSTVVREKSHGAMSMIKNAGISLWKKDKYFKFRNKEFMELSWWNTLFWAVSMFHVEDSGYTICKGGDFNPSNFTW